MQPAAEPWRPLAHFSPATGWMNDPNGLVVVDDEYHLFFQYHPHSTVWGPMHWGHAISRDLVSWEELPIALAPDTIGAIFSGSAVADPDNSSGLVPGGGLVAMFSYDNQSQGIAASTDRGRTWRMHEGNPVLAPTATDFRDPKVFRHDDGWSMVLAVGDHVEFFRSPDLLTWEATGGFTVDIPGVASPFVWECPDLFELPWRGGTVWVLLVSVNGGAPAGGSGTVWFAGRYDGRTFTADGPPTWLDWGPDCYAGVTWNGAPQRTLIAWMSNWVYAQETPTQAWRSAMTTARILALADDGAPVLTQHPVLAADPPLALPADGAQAQVGLPAVIEARLTPDWNGVRIAWPASVGGRGLGTGAEGDHVLLVWDPAAGGLALDRRGSGRTSFNAAFPGRYEAPVRAGLPSLDFTVVIDRCSVEVFADGGRSCITALVFPGRPEDRPAESVTATRVAGHAL